MALATLAGLPRDLSMRIVDFLFEPVPLPAETVPTFGPPPDLAGLASLCSLRLVSRSTYRLVREHRHAWLLTREAVFVSAGRENVFQLRRLAGLSLRPCLIDALLWGHVESRAVIDLVAQFAETTPRAAFSAHARAMVCAWAIAVDLDVMAMRLVDDGMEEEMLAVACMENATAVATRLLARGAAPTRECMFHAVRRGCTSIVVLLADRMSRETLVLARDMAADLRQGPAWRALMNALTIYDTECIS